jgi:hypothetical protein
MELLPRPPSVDDEEETVVYRGSDRVAISALLPLRKMTERGLLVVLDDKKRAIRKLGAKVRNEWMVLK